MKSPTRLAWLISIGIASLLAIAGIITIGHQGRSTPAPLVVLTRPFFPPVRLRDRLESKIPNTTSWAWAHRLVNTAFGSRKAVNLDAESFAFRGAFASRAIEVELGPPAFSVPDPQMSIWFPDHAGITALRKQLESADLGDSYRCRVNTADGIGASVFVGNSITLNGQPLLPGIHHDYHPLVGFSGTDLFVSVQVSGLVTNAASNMNNNQETVFVQTNVDFQVRIQIPAGRGVFLVKRQSLGNASRSAGLILDSL